MRTDLQLAILFAVLTATFGWIAMIIGLPEGVVPAVLLLTLGYQPATLALVLGVSVIVGRLRTRQSEQQ